MKNDQESNLLVVLTAEEAEAINGGKNGADDPPGDDKGKGKGNDDGPGHQ
jgi:hypothetical protein